MDAVQIERIHFILLLISMIREYLLSMSTQEIMVALQKHLVLHLQTIQHGLGKQAAKLYK